jgi:cobalt-zinc-cadmium efflux system membrane fusion protein
MRFGKTPFGRGSTCAAAAVIATLSLSACSKPAEQPKGPQVAAPSDDRVELTVSQLKTVTIQPVADHAFSPERTAVGSIDFDEDRAVQVSSNYPGKIISAFGQVGDPVAAGRPLYTIQSPDLAAAESTLIAAAGVYDLTTRALTRDRALHEKQGIADKDLEQAVSDQMTADGALKAARAAVLVFGKTGPEVDAMVSRRQIDPVLVVRSPLTGRVVARNAQPGLLVQPGGTPAPYTVADLSVVWMNANVAEADVPMFRRGQAVNVKVDSFPNRDFAGVISVLGATLDPGTHAETIRSEVKDPDRQLHPGMMATFVIHTGSAQTALALPLDGVVRNGDGSMNVWVATDDRHFTRRTVTLGMQQDGFDQITGGLQPGERVVTRNAVFLSNMANAASSGDD